MSIGDPGFEQVVVGAGQFQYRPDRLTLGLRRQFGHLWQQQRLHLGQSRRHPRACRSPSSREPARSARVSAGWAAGSYVLSFEAAQRGNYQASRQDFNVLIDGRWWAPSHPRVRRTRATPPPRSRSPPGLIRSHSKAWTVPVETTPPSSTRSLSHSGRGITGVGDHWCRFNLTDSSSRTLGSDMM